MNNWRWNDIELYQSINQFIKEMCNRIIQNTWSHNMFNSLIWRWFSYNNFLFVSGFISLTPILMSIYYVLLFPQYSMYSGFLLIIIVSWARVMFQQVWSSVSTLSDNICPCIIALVHAIDFYFLSILTCSFFSPSTRQSFPP